MVDGHCFRADFQEAGESRARECLYIKGTIDASMIFSLKWEEYCQQELEEVTRVRKNKVQNSSKKYTKWPHNRKQ